MKQCATAVAVILWSLITTACVGLSQPTTGLDETATHTGTVALLRIDDAWHFDPSQRKSYHIGEGPENSGARFVPVRFEGNVAGLDGPDRIVTSEDYVTLTLKSGFIKYFRDPGCTRRERLCRGEIAIVLSFDDGKQLKENLLIYSSQGQTLGSPLALDDWPIVGPVKLEGDTLLVRLVLIELDRVENERARQVVQFLTSVAAIADPTAGPALKITQQTADALIGGNSDDVIQDVRFSLQRVDNGALPTRNSLLYGKYVLIQQEDVLANPDVEDVSPYSLNPVALTEMRFDRYSERLYKVYPYRDEPCPEATGRYDWITFHFGPACEASEDQDLADVEPGRPDRDSAIARRIGELGFSERLLDTYELWGSQDEAFYRAMTENCRSAPTDAESGWSTEDFTTALRELCPRSVTRDGAFRFDYPASLYPDANVLLSGYALHTHLIFSIDRSLANSRRFDERFVDFEEYLAGEVKTAQAEDHLQRLGQLISEVRADVREQETLFRKVTELGPSNPETRLAFAKTCLLWLDGLDGASDAPPDPLLAAPIYNEIYHVTGRAFDDPGDVERYLETGGGCEADRDNSLCSCPEVG